MTYFFNICHFSVTSSLMESKIYRYGFTFKGKLFFPLNVVCFNAMNIEWLFIPYIPLENVLKSSLEYSL